MRPGIYEDIVKVWVTPNLAGRIREQAVQSEPTVEHVPALVRPLGGTSHLITTLVLFADLSIDYCWVGANEERRSLPFQVSIRMVTYRHLK